MNFRLLVLCLLISLSSFAQGSKWQIKISKKIKTTSIQIAEEKDDTRFKDYRSFKPVALFSENKNEYKIYSEQALEMLSRMPCMTVDFDRCFVDKDKIEFISYQSGKLIFDIQNQNDTEFKGSNEDWNFHAMKLSDDFSLIANDSLLELQNHLKGKWEYQVISESKDSSKISSFERQNGRSGILYLRNNNSIASIFTETYITEFKEILQSTFNCESCCTSSDQYLHFKQIDGKVGVEYGHVANFDTGWKRDYFIFQQAGINKILIFNASTRIVLNRTYGNLEEVLAE